MNGQQHSYSVLMKHRVDPMFRREAGATQDARVVRIAGRKAF